MARNSCQIGQQLGFCEITSLIGKVGMGEVFDSYKHTKSTVTRIGVVQSQEESSRDSEAAMIGGERDGKPRHSRIFYVASGSISSREGLCFVFESFF
jgi:hypothetical protein